jgi:type III pantothenate kinase
VLLAVDVSNSLVSLGLYDGDRLAASWRVATRRDATADQVAAELDQLFRLAGLERAAITAMVLGSVVPELNIAFEEAGRRHFGCQPLVVGPGTRTGVRLRNENPKEVGPDRVANAVAAQRRHGTPTVVIDFATAITYDAISADGEYLGCAIAPGLDISHEALIAGTSRLQHVEMSAPASVIGRTTTASIQAGLVWGVVSQVEGMVVRMVGELGGQARVVATGAHAELIAGLTSAIDAVDPLLTLEGLRWIYEMNLDGHPGR